MKKLFLSALLCLAASTTIQADPFVILPNGELAFTTSFNTDGILVCSQCTGSGTSSIVFGSGANTVSLTLTGVSNTLLVGADPVTTTMAQIHVTTTGTGFVFPVGSNPNVRTIFIIVAVTQTSPTFGTSGKAFSAPGGGTSLPFDTLVSNWIQFPTGPNPPGFNYTNIVYTFLPFTIPNTDGVVNINANLSAIPEPASLLLLGSGIGVMLGLLKKRSARGRSTG
jgi:hypothetical protein